MNETYIWCGGIGLGMAFVLAMWLWYELRKVKKK